MGHKNYTKPINQFHWKFTKEKEKEKSIQQSQVPGDDWWISKTSREGSGEIIRLRASNSLIKIQLISIWIIRRTKFNRRTEDFLLLLLDFLPQNQPSDSFAFLFVWRNTALTQPDALATWIAPIDSHLPIEAQNWSQNFEY